MSRSVSLSASAPSACFSSGAPAVRGAGWLSPLSRRLPLLACGLLLPVSAVPAAELTASDGAPSDTFGVSVGLSGGMGLVGAHFADRGAAGNVGAAYFFQDAFPYTGFGKESGKLTASDGVALDQFGFSVSLSGTTGLIGTSISGGGMGSAYLFRNLYGRSGTTTEDAKLVPSTGAAAGYFGKFVSLSGSTALVGAHLDDIGNVMNTGSAHLFRNLDTRTGTITENARLTASDGAQSDFLGWSVSLSGNTGLVGARYDDVGGAGDAGSAYVFRNLDTRTGITTEDAKLTASDGAEDDFFGVVASISGSIGLIGAYGDDAGSAEDTGSAYLFRNLDTRTGTTTETAKLTASDGAAGDEFGCSVSLSGSTALVGAQADSFGESYWETFNGSVYFFRDLDTKTGAIGETFKIHISDGMETGHFGRSVALEGDQFLSAAHTENGKVYSGRVSTFTTLDEDNGVRTTSGYSFVSQDDWVVGQRTDRNHHTISFGDTGTVSAPGKGVYVGRGAGSDNNSLLVIGKLTANTVRVGAAGNTGNGLRIDGTLITKVGDGGGVTIASGSLVSGKGSLTGDLRLEAGAFWGIPYLSESLNVHGRVFLDRSFGVASVLGVDAGSQVGTQKLFTGTLTDFSALGLTNWGEANAFNLGGGKRAWLAQANGDLSLVVAAGGPEGGDLPALNLSRAGEQLTLTWTTPVLGLLVETSTAVTGGWQKVPDAPVRYANLYTLTLPFSGERRFYRLHRP